MRGSSEYGERPYEKTEGRWQRKVLEGRIPERHPGGAYPPLGSRVLHRHWEIKKMYDYQKKRNRSSENKMLNIFFIFMVGFIISLVLYQQKAITGYMFLENAKIPNILFFFLLFIFFILLYFLRKK